MPPRASRPFNNWLLVPPFPTAMYVMAQPATPDLLWHLIGFRAEIVEQGRALFSGSIGQRNSLWREFRNYVRQAKEYELAARGVAGSSGSLLHYYVALNLAKAELLISNPTAIVGQRINHGLTFNPTAS